MKFVKSWLDIDMDSGWTCESSGNPVYGSWGRGEGAGVGGESMGKYILWDSNEEEGCVGAWRRTMCGL